MNRRFIIAALAVLVSISAYGQVLFEEIVLQVNENSLELKALRTQADADILEQRTGLAPSNPELEIGYLPGSPTSIGVRKDISLTQEFDFPTAYSNRKKLAESRTSGINNEYLSQRTELLVEVQELCAELVYQNALYSLYDSQMQNAQSINNAFSRMGQTGAAGAMEVNKSRLNLAIMQDRLSRIELERDRIKSEIARKNGGIPVHLDTNVFNTLEITESFDEMMERCKAQDPSMAFYQDLCQSAAQNTRTVRSESLPKWSVGYTGEFVPGENYSGVTIGLSIPLWENRGRIKHAKAQEIAARTTAQSAAANLEAYMNYLYSSALALENTIKVYSQAVEQASNQEMLLKSYQSGAINLLDYLMEIQYLFECSDSLLQAQRDLYVTYCRLYAFML